MSFDGEKHHRRSIRLKGFDYSRDNAFFVTICSYQKEPIFGNILNDAMIPNEHGKLVQRAWLETAAKRPNIQLDEFVIMPNHFHGIILIVDDAQGRGTACRAPYACRAQDTTFCAPNTFRAPYACRAQDTTFCAPNTFRAPGIEIPAQGTARCAPTTDLKCEQFGRPVPSSLPTIIRSFKAAASKYVNESRRSPGVPVWQRNYYEHIIRDRDELQQIRAYIRSNPSHWPDDDENPTNSP